jgi:hypothetical protein
LSRFLTEEHRDDEKIGRQLAELGLIDDMAIARALAEQSQLRFEDLSGQDPDLVLTGSLDRGPFLDCYCIPMRREEGALVVGFASPPALEEFDRIKEAAGSRVRACIVAENMLLNWLHRAYHMDVSPRPAGLRYPVQLRVEYRFLSSDWKTPQDGKASVGLTREISRKGMLLGGPLPDGITPELVSDKNFKLAVQADSRELPAPITVGCRPVRIRPSDYSGEYLIHCSIEKFPGNSEQAWSRLCMVKGTQRFRFSEISQPKSSESAENS